MRHETITTPRRRDEVLAFIVQWMVKDHVSPTLDEIGTGLGVSKSRARQLVDELVADGIIEKTPGAQRKIRVRDVGHAREILVRALNELGGTTASPMADLKQPCPNVQLPRVLKIRHIPDE